MIQLKPFRTLGILPVLAGMALTGVHAQTMTDKPNDPMMKIYRATPAKINDLVHTKLDVRFDYKKCYLYGKEWVTLKPHFYSHRQPAEAGRQRHGSEQYLGDKKRQSCPFKILL